MYLFFKACLPFNLERDYVMFIDLEIIFESLLGVVLFGNSMFLLDFSTLALLNDLSMHSFRVP